jgi:DNA topoisomerase I
MQNEAQKLARQAHLRYVTDAAPGIRRRRAGTGYSYYDHSGRRITDAAERRRIDSLAIPPAWTAVWICPLPHGHLQATGRDAKGRKQYRYHPRWNELARQASFGSLHGFGELLPRIRRRVNLDLSRQAMDKRKIVATVIALLDETLIRVGNESYARDNGSFGLTTLRRRHVKMTPTTATFRFRGKSGIVHEVDLRERRLVRILHRCCEIPGQELFQYFDDVENEYHTVDSQDVNEYLRDAADPQYSAKNFRTWTGTTLMAGLLYRTPVVTNKRLRQRTLRQAYQQVADQLHNTVAVCRKHYVHPELTLRFIEDQFPSLCDGFQPRRRRWYSSDEQLTLYILERLQRKK